MLFYAKLTSQGQISIPSKIRKALGIENDSKVLLELDEKKKILTLSPSPDVTELYGVINDRAIKNKSIDEVIHIEEKAIYNAITSKYKKSK